MKSIPTEQEHTQFKVYTVEELRNQPPRHRLPALVVDAPSVTTWAALVRHEPRLGDLMAEVERVTTHPGVCANRAWYRVGGIRERMIELVGWFAERRDPFLETTEAYDIAYRTLYDRLPDCRHAGLCRG